MPRDAVSRTANVGTVGKNGLSKQLLVQMLRLRMCGVLQAVWAKLKIKTLLKTKNPKHKKRKITYIPEDSKQSKTDQFIINLLLFISLLLIIPRTFDGRREASHQVGCRGPVLKYILFHVLREKYYFDSTFPNMRKSGEIFLKNNQYMIVKLDASLESSKPMHITRVYIFQEHEKKSVI